MSETLANIDDYLGKPYLFLPAANLPLTETQRSILEQASGLRLKRHIRQYKSHSRVEDVSAFNNPDFVTVLDLLRKISKEKLLKTAGCGEATLRRFEIIFGAIDIKIPEKGFDEDSFWRFKEIDEKVEKFKSKVRRRFHRTPFEALDKANDKSLNPYPAVMHPLGSEERENDAPYVLRHSMAIGFTNTNKVIGELARNFHRALLGVPLSEYRPHEHGGANTEPQLGSPYALGLKVKKALAPRSTP